jgi:hypothetical protein
MLKGWTADLVSRVTEGRTIWSVLLWHEELGLRQRDYSSEAQAIRVIQDFERRQREEERKYG